MPAPPAEPDPGTQAVLLDAAMFYASRLASSWAPAYLRKRGLTSEAIGKWHIGYAPCGWTTLLTHLRGRGHRDDAIQAAGLARTSSRGTPIDHFRDRVMLPVHDEHGNLAGFTGRARPGSASGVPKYLNTPETSSYKKGNLLFGLYQARDRLVRGATPVIAEGPSDAIAITLASQSRQRPPAGRRALRKGSRGDSPGRRLLPAETGTAIRRMTGNRELETIDEGMRPVADPALPEIARTLPAGIVGNIGTEPASAYASGTDGRSMPMRPTNLSS